MPSRTTVGSLKFSFCHSRLFALQSVGELKAVLITYRETTPLRWTDLRYGSRQAPARYLLPGAICCDPHRLKVVRMTLGSSLPTLREYPSAGLVMKGLKCKFPGHSLKMSFSKNAINKLVVIFCCLKLTSNQGN